MLKGGKNGPAIVPGSSQKSLLVQHLTGEKKPVMPMGQDPLPASEIAVLKSWIDQGAGLGYRRSGSYSLEAHPGTATAGDP